MVTMCITYIIVAILFFAYNKYLTGGASPSPTVAVGNITAKPCM